MNSLRPLIILRANSDITSLTAAVRAAVACRVSDGLILVEVPSAGKASINRMLDFWGCSDAGTEAIGKRGHDFAGEIARFGLRFRVEVCRELTPAKIQKYARQLNSDLIITERSSNVSGRFLNYLNDDTGMLIDCRIPVWLCGKASDAEGIIVAAIDPVPETQAGMENNTRVIQTAFALADKYAPKKKIHFMAICEADSALTTSSLKQARTRAMNDLRAEIFRTWANFSQHEAINRKGQPLRTSPCVPVQISMHHSSPELVSMTLDEIRPKVIVTGKPLRSAVSRFFRPGMLSAFSNGPHSILTVTERQLTSEMTRPGDVDTDAPSTTVRRDAVTHREIAC